MASKSIEAGKAFLKLLVDDKEFAQGLAGSFKKLESFGRSAIKVGAGLGAVGAALTAPFVASLKVFAATGDELEKMNARTAISVESLSELKFAAEQSGASLRDIGIAAREMQSRGLDPRTFDEVAARIAAIQDPTQRAQEAFVAWGKRAGTALLPMLANLKELRKQARDAGLVMSTQAARDAAKLGDAFSLLTAQGVAVAQAIGGAVAPAVTHLAGALSTALPAVIDFIHRHETLVTVAGVLGVSLLTLAAGITAVGTAAFYARSGIAALRTALTVLSRHPYAVAITLIATGVAVLADRFLSAGEAASSHANSLRDTTAATNEAAAATQRLVTAQEKSIFQQALARLESEKSADAVQKEVDRIKELNRRLEIHYRIVRERGLPPGINPQNPLADPNRNNPFNNFEQQEFGRKAGEAIADFFKTAPKPAEDTKIKTTIDEAARSRDEILDQLNSTIRGFRGGAGGKLAAQIAGVSSTNSIESRMLKVQEDQRKSLQDVVLLLKRSGVLIAGGG